MAEERAKDVTAYDAFGQLARRMSSPVSFTGRPSFQAAEMPDVIADVQQKLVPERSNRLLEIGCNVGILLTPLASLVAEAVGIDHPQLLDQYRTMGVPENVTLLAGQWPEVKPEGQFDRILVYSVIQYVLDARSAIAFLDACLASLRPGGRLLLGDLPNRDAKARFLSSPAGQSFNASWNDRKALSSPEDEIIVSSFESLTIDPIACFDDEFLLRLLRDTRQKGFESYLLPQPAVLPFGNTREDVLIIKRY